VRWLRASWKWIAAGIAVLAGLYLAGKANKFEKRYQKRSEELDRIDAAEVADATGKARVHQAKAHVAAAKSHEARARAERRIEKLKADDHSSMADLVARHNGGLRNGPDT
jgi:outer membrane murein-binding lipoprotein Lpp